MSAAKLVNYAIKALDDHFSALSGVAYLESEGDHMRIEWVNGAVDEITVTIRRTCEPDA